MCLHPIERFVKQVAKLTVTILNRVSSWQIVPSSHFTILEIDSVNPVNIDHFLVVYCLDRDFHFMIWVGTIGILVQQSIRNTWIYTPTALKSIMELEAESTLGNRSQAFLSGYRITVACFRSSLEVAVV